MKKNNMKSGGQKNEMNRGINNEIGQTTQSILKEIPMTFDSIITASQIINLLLRRTYESVFSNAVDAMLHRYSLEKCKEIVTDITGLFCTSHDNGEYPRTCDESIREHLWEVPSEPMPTEIDTCGRGILNVKKEYKFMMPLKEEKKMRKTTLSRCSVSRLIKKMLPPKKEENSIIPYPLYTEKIEDDFEQQIDDMRQKMKNLEILQQEKEKEHQEKQKRLQEYEEKKKDMNYNMTYNINGKLVDLEELNSLPQLTTRIQQQLLEGNGGLSPRKKKIFYSKKKTKETNLWETEFLQMSTARAKQSKKFSATAKVYDYIVPSSGVTFLEGKKNPKTTGITVGQKMGRIGREEFMSQLITDGTFRAQTSAPSQSQLGMLPPLDLYKPTTVPTIAMTSQDLLTGNEIVPLKRRKPPKGVDIDGDINQLFVASQYYYNKPKTPSITPRLYVPPTFRHKELPKPLPLVPQNFEKRDLDIFNSNISDNYSINSTVKPIVRAKATTKR